MKIELVSSQDQDKIELKLNRALAQIKAVEKGTIAYDTLLQEIYRCKGVLDYIRGEVV